MLQLRALTTASGCVPLLRGRHRGVALLAGVIVLVLQGATPAPAFPRGDCNCSGSLDAGDPVCAVLRLIGAFEPDSCGPSTTLAPPFDMDGDGFTNASCGGTDCDDTDAAISPSADERCNGVDDNCDGATDELYPDLGEDCGIGACAGGVIVCAANALTTECSTAGNVGVELCNGVDDDCNGATDEPYPELGDACGLGACAGGVVVCAANAMTTECSTAGNQSPESCNGSDDDCDGQVDEDCTCLPDTYDCDGVGSCECTAGTGCCGTECQNVHENGLGQNFYDCVQLGTHDLSQAEAACLAFTGDALRCHDYGLVCNGDLSGGADTRVVCGDYTVNSGDCACWGYSGPAAGYVYNAAGTTSCQCPYIGSLQWN